MARSITPFGLSVAIVLVDEIPTVSDRSKLAKFRFSVGIVGGRLF
jgi:hypothetical protein